MKMYQVIMKTKQTLTLALLLLGVSLAREAQAFYNPSTGRWLSRDPAGEINPYSFVRNNTQSKYDVLGLWGSDVHYGMTINWAVDIGIAASYANIVGMQDDAIDTLYDPTTISEANWAWHFNRSPAGRKDSRLILSELQIKAATRQCDCHLGTDDALKASTYLGHALHTPFKTGWRMANSTKSLKHRELQVFILGKQFSIGITITPEVWPQPNR